MSTDVKFQIEKNVPIPPPRQSNSPKYPFREMDIGDSFFVPVGAAPVDSVRAMANDASRRFSRKYSVRKLDDGARVWRTQ